MKPLTRKNISLLNAAAIALCAALWFLWDRACCGGATTAAALPLRDTSLPMQWLVVLTAFGVKPLYLLVALALIVWLWRSTARDLALLRWGLIWFWFGENACSVNYIFFHGGCDFWEYLHNFGMAASFSLILAALLEGFDHRVIKFSPPKEHCAVLPLCGACSKYAAVPCRLPRLFAALLPALIVVALLPLTADFATAPFRTNILGTSVNYEHLASSTWFELRACPALALVLFTASWLVLLFKKTEPVTFSKALLAAGLGPFSFGLLRLFLVSTFAQNLIWSDQWEEFTELLFILGVALVLWLFRARLFAADTTNPKTSTP